MAIRVLQNRLRVNSLDMLLEITPWGDDALRVRATRNASLPSEGEVLLPVASEQSFQVDVADGDQSTVQLMTGITDLEAADGDVEAKVRQGNLLATYNKGQLSFYRVRDGKCLLQGSRLVDSAGNAQTVTGSFHSLGSGSYRMECTFKAWEDEQFFGLGQHRHGFLDQKGCVLDLLHHCCEINIPFMVSSRGYGFIWNNPSVGRVELGRNRTVWVAEKNQAMDFVVKAGETPADILSWYADATGHAPEFPRWASGFWQCKLRYRTQDELMAVAREYKRRKLPLSVIVIDYLNWSHSGDYAFEERDWPDPEGMIRELKDMGVELVVSNWPTVSMSSRNFNALHEAGCLVSREHGPPFHVGFKDSSRSAPWEPLALVDPTLPETRKRIWDLVEAGYGCHGIRSFWLDAIEPELITERPDLEDIKYRIGNAMQTGALYPWYMQKLYYDGLKEKGETEFMTLCRSGYLGSQRFGAAIWSGDVASSFEALQGSIRSGLNMAMSGILWWCTDIGGFHGGNIDSPEFRELIVRWFQYGLFCPVFRLHGLRSSDGEAGFGEVANEIWSFGQRAEQLITRILKLRECLRPYIMEHMAIASKTGLPVMRPMFVDFPDDPHCWRCEDQYMFGPEFLVAPVAKAGATNRNVYLPQGGRWKSLWNTDRVEDGGQRVMDDAPLEKIPVWVPEDSKYTFMLNP